MKAQRHAAILRIIKERPIETQSALAEALREAGFRVTQATVSRDVAELGLVKRAMGDGRYRWEPPATAGPREALERAKRAFQDYVTGMDYSGNLIVIRTLPGTAPAVAGALDALEWETVLATLAGDDTILVVVAEPGRRGDPLESATGPVARLLRQLRELMRPEE